MCTCSSFSLWQLLLDIYSSTCTSFHAVWMVSSLLLVCMLYVLFVCLTCLTCPSGTDGIPSLLLVCMLYVLFVCLSCLTCPCGTDVYMYNFFTACLYSMCTVCPNVLPYLPIWYGCTFFTACLYCVCPACLSVLPYLPICTTWPSCLICLHYLLTFQVFVKRPVFLILQEKRTVSHL